MSTDRGLVMREHRRTLVCAVVLTVVAGLSASFTVAASADTAVTDPCAIQQTKPGFPEVVTACIVPVEQHGYSELRWSIAGGSPFIRSFVITSPFPGYASEVPNIIPIPGCTPNLGTTSGLDLGHLYGYTCPASSGQGVVGPFPYGTNQPLPFPVGSITFLGTDCEINPGPHCEPTFDHIPVSGTYTIYGGGTPPPPNTGCTSPTLAMLDGRTLTVVSGDVKATVGERVRLDAVMTCLDSTHTEPATGVTWTLGGNPVDVYFVSDERADAPKPF